MTRLAHHGVVSILTSIVSGAERVECKGCKVLYPAHLKACPNCGRPQPRA